MIMRAFPWILIAAFAQASLPAVSGAAAAQPHPDRHGVAVLDANGAFLAQYETAGPASDVAVMPNGEEFAAGTLNGELSVRRGDGTILFQRYFFPINDVDYLPGIDAFLLTSRPTRQVAIHYRATQNRERVPFSFAGPTDADLLPNGNFLVSDAAGNRVVELSRDGAEVWSYGTGLAQPMDALRLGNGNTLISDFDNHRVIEVSPGKQILAEHKGFDHPIKLSPVNEFTFLVADGDHRRLVELRLDGAQRVIAEYLNYIQAADFLPEPGYYLCAIHNRFPPPETAAATAAPTAGGGVPAWLVSPYAFLALAAVLGIVARRAREGSEFARLSLLGSHALLFAIGYFAITRAGAVPPHNPPAVFWLSAALLLLLARGDSKRAFYPASVWGNESGRLVQSPYGAVYTLILLAWPVVPLLLQYYRVAGGNGSIGWQWPMAGWLVSLYFLFRPLAGSSGSRGRERTEVMMGNVRLAVPFTTGSVNMDASGRDEDRPDPASDAPYQHSWANTTVLILLILSAALYIVGATSVPTDVHGDEGEVALHALELLREGRWNVFDLGWYQIPNLFYLVPAASMWLFGSDLFGMRMAGALTSLGSIPVFYLLARRFLYPIPASIAVFLFSASAYYIHFSRMGTGYTQATLIGAAAMYFTVRGVQDRDGRPLCLAGFMAALGFLSYQSAHILAPLMLLTIALLWAARRIPLGQTAKSGWIFALAFWVTLSPLFGNFLRDPGALTSRARSVSLFSEDGRDLIRVNYPPNMEMDGIVKEQFRRALLAPISHRDQSPYLNNARHGGVLDPLPALLFTAGILLLITTIRHPSSWILLLWTALILIPGAAFTNSSPSYQRLTLAFPLFALAAAPLLYGVFAQFQRIFQLSVAARETVLGCVFAGLLILTMNRYFHQIMRTPQKLDLHTRIARYLDEKSPHAYTYFFGHPLMYFNYGTIRFLAPEAQGRDVTQPERFLDYPIQRNGPVIFLLLEPNRPYLRTLREKFPGGLELHHHNPEGGNPFTTYEVHL